MSGFLANFLYSRGVYRSGQQQFLNANFVWNQDEVSQNSRYAKRDFTILDSLAPATMQHFDDSRHSFAKIAIPYTIYPSLNSSGFLPSFLYSRYIYRFSQQQFSCAQRARRKFRMEPVRNCGKICQRVTFCYIPLFLWFQMLIC